MIDEIKKINREEIFVTKEEKKITLFEKIITILGYGKKR
jgi:hypothetical protein